MRAYRFCLFFLLCLFPITLLACNESGGSGSGGGGSSELSPPELTVSATNLAMNQGTSASFSWSTKNASVVHIDQGSGQQDINGSTAFAPEHTTVYTITATGAGGSVNKKVLVRVLGSPTPPAEGTYGEQYEDLIPDDATIDAYDDESFAMITGFAHDISGSPLSEVLVTIKDYPEYGSTRTDETGRFVLPVEGGPTFTVIYQKEGYITAHREVETTAKDIAIAETPELIQEDSASTFVQFDGNAETVVTHTSSTHTDDFGQRATTLVFTGDNKAWAVDENGERTHQLPSITVRATEFATKDSMPAVLPPLTAYTFCAELKVDGIERVAFEKPVAMWVENFLAFPEGMAVPTGYYDRDKGVWIAIDNGIVVTLLDTTGDGLVDALDTDGDGQPNDLDGNGTFSDEVEGIEHFTPGSSYWRVEIEHFTPWDCNWPFGPPMDIGDDRPDQEPESESDAEDEEKDPCDESSSYFQHKGRVYHDDIAIPGTNINLHYSSKRTQGYTEHQITVPITGPTVSEHLQEVDVHIDYAGRRVTQTYAPEAGKTAVFDFDSRDFLGRTIGNTIQAQVKIEYIYPAVYYEPAEFAQAFNQVGGAPLTRSRARQVVSVWKNKTVLLQTPGLKHSISSGQGQSERKYFMANGWTLSNHHRLEPVTKETLFLGSGSSSFVPQAAVLEDQPGSQFIFKTYAGTGEYGISGDNGPALESELDVPTFLTANEAGDLYFIDERGKRIRKINSDGIISTVITTQNSTFIRLTRGPENTIYGVEELGDNTLKVFKLSSDNSKSTVNIPSALETGTLTGLAITSRKTIIFTLLNDPRILEYGPNVIGTQVLFEAAEGMELTPQNITLDSKDTLYFFILEEPYGLFTLTDSGQVSSVTSAYAFRASAPKQPRLVVVPTYESSRPITFDSQNNIYFHNGYSIVKVYPSTGSSKILSSNADYSMHLEVDVHGRLFMAGLSTNTIEELVSNPLYREFVNVDGERRLAVQSPGPNIYFTFDNLGLHRENMGLNGAFLEQFVYDDSKNLVRIIDAFGNTTHIERYSDGSPTAIVSPYGHRTTLQVDAEGNLKNLTFPDGGRYTFNYRDGLLISKTDPGGHASSQDYDTMGRLVRITGSDGAEWTLGKEKEGVRTRINTVTTGEGNTTTHIERALTKNGDFDTTLTGTTSDGETIEFKSNQSEIIKTEYKTTSPARETFCTTVDVDGKKQERISCGMTTITTTEDDAETGKTISGTIKTTTPSGLTRSGSWERNETAQKAGSPLIKKVEQVSETNFKSTRVVTDYETGATTITSPENRQYKTIFDVQTLLTTKVESPGSLPIEFGYNAKGQLSSLLMGDRQNSFAYDAKGNLVTATDALGRGTSYSYDDMDRLTREVAPDGSVVEYGYDQKGNITRLVTPVGGEYRFTYNGANNPTSGTGQLSGTTRYNYDKERKLTGVTLPSGKAITNTYTDGRLTQINTPDWSAYYTWDCSSNPARIARGSEVLNFTWDGTLMTGVSQSGTVNQSIGFTYNNDFLITGMRYAGATENTAYDKDGLPIQIGRFSISRNRTSGLPGQVADGTFTVQRVFSQYGELSSMDYRLSGSALKWDVERNKLGLITKKTETVGGVAVAYDYTYDDFGRLLTVTQNGSQVEAYTYDANGNRQSELNTHLGINRTYSHNIEDQTTEAGSITYHYNDDDFLSKKMDGTETTLYDYSSMGELKSVTLPDGMVVSYTHDALTRPVAKSIDGAITEKYLWSGRIQLLAVLEADNSVRQRFVYADDRMPYAMQQSGQVYYLAYDQVGSLRMVTDASGNIVKQVQYDTFGNILTDSNPSFSVPFGFAGGLHDQDTGLVRFGYRDYAPEIGRWTAKDPIGFAGGDSNLYGYVFSDPVNFVDPLGLWFWDWHTARNLYNKCPKEKPHEKEDGNFYDCDGNKWNPDNVGSSKKFHGYNKGKRTFRGIEKFEGSQCTYNPDGTLDDSSSEMGTYDFISPDGFWSMLGHFGLDVLPHLIDGNYTGGLTEQY